MPTLEQAAKRVAKTSFEEVTTEPEVYGICEPWQSIQEWIDFELDGAGPEELMRDFGITYGEASNVLQRAMKEYATLEELNAPFPAWDRDHGHLSNEDENP